MADTYSEQLDAVQRVITEALPESVEGAYLYGSAVAGGLRSASDLDLFVVLNRPTTRDERAALVQQLRPLSRRDQRPQGWRPVELTAVVLREIKPWRYPPRTDFQYGEWLRDRFDAGDVDPEKPHDPDLALLVAMVRQNGRALLGPSPTDLLPQVPHSDISAALIGVVPDLLADLPTDTANVLLTLARVWHTLQTRRFVSKDAAADWALDRLPERDRPALKKARDVYLGDAVDDWSKDPKSAAQTAELLASAIRG